MTPCTVDTIADGVFPTPLPVSTVTAIADPAVVDKVRGLEGSLGVPLGMAGVHADNTKGAMPVTVPDVVTVVVHNGGPVLVFFVLIFVYEPRGWYFGLGVTGGYSFRILL